MGSHKILTAIETADTWAKKRELIMALKYLPGKRIDNYLAKTFSDDEATEQHKLLAAMTLAKRHGGSDTEAAIGKVADSVEQLGESTTLCHTTKQVFAERLKEFHSPAAMRLMLVHHKKTPAADLGEQELGDDSDPPRRMPAATRLGASPKLAVCTKVN